MSMTCRTGVLQCRNMTMSRHARDHDSCPSAGPRSARAPASAEPVRARRPQLSTAPPRIDLALAPAQRAFRETVAQQPQLIAQLQRYSSYAGPHLSTDLLPRDKQSSRNPAPMPAVQTTPVRDDGAMACKTQTTPSSAKAAQTQTSTAQLTEARSSVATDPVPGRAASEASAAGAKRRAPALQTMDLQVAEDCATSLRALLPDTQLRQHLHGGRRSESPSRPGTHVATTTLQHIEVHVLFGQLVPEIHHGQDVPYCCRPRYRYQQRHA